MSVLQFEARKSGIPSVVDLPWGSHLSQFYDSKQDLLDILIPYFKAGLENNEFCLWAVPAPLRVEEALAELGKAVPRLPEYLSAGQIKIVPEAEAASPEADSIGSLVSRVDQAVLMNCDGLRLARHPFRDETGIRPFSTHDQETLAALNLIAIFLYPRRQFDAVGLMEVVTQHRLTLVRGADRWEVLESSAALSVKDELRRTEEKLHILFANMSEGFAFHRIVLDAGGKPCDYIFLEINDAFARLTGLKPDRIIGQRVTAVMPGIEKDSADWIGIYGKVALTGQPVQFESYAAPLQRWYAISAFSPRKGFFACTFSDITERKRAEEERRSLAERLAVTLHSIGDAVLSTDAEGRITFLNPVAAALTGWKEPEALGRPISDVFRIANELSGEEGEDIVGKAIREKRIVALANNTALISRDGQRIPIEDSAAPILTADGQIAGAVLVFHDVTAKRRAQAALQQAHDELENRVAERTDQLRRANLQLEARAAQLRALTGELTLAEQRERRRIAQMLHDGLQQILVGAKFRVSSLERSADDRTRATCTSINSLLDEAIQASRTLTAEISPPILYEQGLVPALRWLVDWIADKHGLTVELSSETVPSRLAEDMLVHLFESVREILFNIVKHASTDRAHIDIRCGDGKLQISVADQGSGFDPDSLRASGGSAGGFGLFTIRERLGLLGGDLDVASAPGKGTRVILTAPTVFAMVPDRSREQRIRLLIVDDHPIMRDGLTKLFSEEPGIEVIGEVSDGQSAVDLAVNLTPDVILMDINMSGMNGIEATRIIRERVPQVRVLGLSMIDNEEIIRAMLDAGAAAYLSKSGSTEEIVRAVKASVQSSDSETVAAARRRRVANRKQPDSHSEN